MQLDAVIIANDDDDDDDDNDVQGGSCGAWDLPCPPTAWPSARRAW
jgi:hypothetical protein